MFRGTEVLTTRNRVRKIYRSGKVRGLAHFVGIADIFCGYTKGKTTLIQKRRFINMNMVQLSHSGKLGLSSTMRSSRTSLPH